MGIMSERLKGFWPGKAVEVAGDVGVEVPVKTVSTVKRIRRMVLYHEVAELWKWREMSD